MWQVQYKSLVVKSVILISLLMSSNLWAQENEKSSMALPQNSEPVSSSRTAPLMAPSSRAGSDLRLKFDLSALNYFSSSSVDQNFQEKFQTDFSWTKKGFVFSDVEATVGRMNAADSAYMTMPQAYVGVGQSHLSYVTFGRHVNRLSTVDDYFHLGQYHPYFSNDLIGFQDQGTVGIHLQLFNGSYGFNLGWNPYFLPNQGPQLHEKDGRLESSNRWAQRVPTKYVLTDEAKPQPIQYFIRPYDLTEIIQNPSETVSFFWGASAARPYLRVAYAYQPVNDVPLSRATYSRTLNSVGQVDLSPVVTYQHLWSTDLNYDFSIFQTTFSYLEDKPMNKVAEPGDTLQFLNPMKVYGVMSSANLEGIFNRKLKITVGYSEVHGGEIQDLTSAREESLFTFANRRAQFERPFVLGFETDSYWFGSRPLISNLKWTYDQRQKGSLLSALFQHQTFQDLTLNLGFDVLGVQEQAAKDDSNQYLQRNQANDRFYGGMQYVF